MKNILIITLCTFTITISNAQWTNTGNNFTTGQLGIGGSGTWAPITINSISNSTGNNGIALAFEGAGYSEIGYRFKANGNNYYQVLYNGNSIQWKYYNGSYVPRMTLNNSGYLGIGTNTPNSLLHIKSTIANQPGSIIIQGKQDSNTHNSAEMIFSTEHSSANTQSGNQTGRKAIIRATANSTWGQNLRLGFFTSNNISSLPVERMTISPNGNIGIGTTTPSAELEVKSTGNNDARIHINSTVDGDQSIVRFQDAGVSTWGFLSNYPGTGKFSLYNYQNSSNAMVFDENGNVGLGTTSPLNGLNSTGLHIDRGGHTSLLVGDGINDGGIIQSSDNRQRIFIGSNLYDDQSASWQNFKSGNSSAVDLIGDLGLIRFLTSASANGYNASNIRMTILPNGNIGIGTETTGSHKLAVEGSIGARSVKVEANGWSDFVFDDDYKLSNLKDVEKYITENNHLPEIPSETEVKKNGINLGEMDAKLLQKIEELTLYLIEQNKQLESQSALLSAQQQRIDLLEKEMSK